jgi:hypothetical protein
MIMRFTASILSFILACALGISLALLPAPVMEWFMPALTKDEAMAMVGHRVRNIYGTDRYVGMKCPERGGLCARVKVGESGRVIAIREVSPNRYFVVVRWDEPNEGEPMLSYFGRKTRRIFLREE